MTLEEDLAYEREMRKTWQEVGMKAADKAMQFKAMLEFMESVTGDYATFANCYPEKNPPMDARLNK